MSEENNYYQFTAQSDPYEKQNVLESISTVKVDYYTSEEGKLKLLMLRANGILDSYDYNFKRQFFTNLSKLSLI